MAIVTVTANCESCKAELLILLQEPATDSEKVVCKIAHTSLADSSVEWLSFWHAPLPSSNTSKMREYVRA